MVALDTSPVTPGQDQLNQTRRRIEAHIESIARHPDRREGAFSYYLLHGVGTPIRGTVLMFHGFSARPHQMAPWPTGV
jgi:hypothetical protein